MESGIRYLESRAGAAEIYYQSLFLTSFSAIILLLCISTASPAHCAPKAEVWERWTAHDPTSTVSVDHRTWDALLGKYLVTSDSSGINLFRYNAVTDLDRTALAVYLDDLQSVEVSALNRLEQMAYWINLYNALTVKIILDHYPVSSIRDIDISPGFFSSGPWGARLLKVEGEKISLDDIEHRILRPIWKDPRIHYAVNCAALGCPDLQGRAFDPESMDRVLDEAAARFINHPRGVHLDSRGRVNLSSIFKWFAADFGGGIDEILGHVRGYAADPLRAKIPARGKVKVKYRYDWSLNDVK